MKTRTTEDIDKAFFELLSDTYDWWTNNSDLAGTYLQGIYDMRNYLIDMEDKDDSKR